MPYLLYIYSSISFIHGLRPLSIQIHVLYTLNFFVTMFDIIRRNLYPSFEIYTTLHEPRLSEIHTKAKSALVENILSFLKPKKFFLLYFLDDETEIRDDSSTHLFYISLRSV